MWKTFELKKNKVQVNGFVKVLCYSKQWLNELIFAFFPLAGIGFSLGEGLKRFVLFWALKEKGAGRENLLFGLIQTLQREVEEMEMKKMKFCLEYRLPAGSACTVNVKTNFVFAIASGEKFNPLLKVLPGSPTASVFKLKIYFNYHHRSDPARLAETTIYSMDFPSERSEAPGKRAKAVNAYNGYQYLVFFCYKVFKNKELLYGRIYPNLIESEKAIITLDESNIYLVVRELLNNKT